MGNDTMPASMVAALAGSIVVGGLIWTAIIAIVARLM